MSLALVQGTKPNGLEIKTWAIKGLPDISLGDYEISMADFCEAVLYVLTNTMLASDDPRILLVEKIKRLKGVVGAEGNKERVIYYEL